MLQSETTLQSDLNGGFKILVSHRGQETSCQPSEKWQMHSTRLL